MRATEDDKQVISIRIAYRSQPPSYKGKFRPHGAMEPIWARTVDNNACDDWFADKCLLGHGGFLDI